MSIKAQVLTVFMMLIGVVLVIGSMLFQELTK